MNTWTIITAVLALAAAVLCAVTLLTMRQLERERALQESRDAAERALEHSELLSTGFQGVMAALERRLGGFDLQMERMSGTLDRQLGANEQRVERMRTTLADGLDKMQEANARKLDEMRQTVGEKLDTTLGSRLDASFRLVSERLEQVYRGLGEMRSLARGVDDLQKVLSNVKTRGVWGETQLGAMLEQTLAPGQYESNAQVKPGSQERVEYAVRMPGRGGDGAVLLPIDSKFPLECYRRLIEASELPDKARVDDALKALGSALILEARRITGKYVNPPVTTDFAILFLPFEALYAEAMRLGDTAERARNEYRVIIAGPSTLFALLNSLRMGFRTLAIERRSHEVWRLLGAVRQDFGKYSELLEATRAKIEQAGKSIDEAARKTRTIERRLEDVQEMGEAEQLLIS